MLRLLTTIAVLALASAALAGNQPVSFVEPDPNEASPSDLRIAPPPVENPAASPAGPAAGCDTYSACCWSPAWFGSAEALWLQRASEEPLVQALTNLGGVVEEVYPSDQLAPGFRVTVGRYLDCDNTLEGLYFGRQDWSSSRTINGDPIARTVSVFSPNLVIDDIVGGFSDNITFNYAAQLDNAELNLRRTNWQDEVWSQSTLVGFRYFHFQERLDLSGLDATTGAFENLNAAAYNHLFGAQIGRRWLRDDGLWRASIEGKAGLYGNSAGQRVLQVGDAMTGNGPQGVLRDIDDQSTGVAGIFDLTLGLNRRITDRLSLQAGYQMYYILGLALAPSIDGDNGNFSDSLFLHGVSTGLTYEW